MEKIKMLRIKTKKIVNPKKGYCILLCEEQRPIISIYSLNLSGCLKISLFWYTLHKEI